MKQYDFCNNCGKGGHTFSQCKMPVTSNGIIAIRKNNELIEYLTICRRDTLGFVDLIRGKYTLNNYSYLKNIFSEMTNVEKELLRTKTFTELWNGLWGGFAGPQYKSEERISSEKFQALKSGVCIDGNIITMETLLDETGIGWQEPEWGFPKGRRSHQERDMACAIREFEEETGYSSDLFQVINNVGPIDEIFTGSNFKSYKHRYFLVLANNNDTLHNKNSHQQTEVSKISWLSYDDCIKKFRPYNKERIAMLSKLDQALKMYRIYN